MGLTVSDRAASPLRVFGAMLRSYRVKAGMSLEQLGARVYLSDDMVIPASVAVHPALAGAGFVVADFADAPPVAYQETQVGGQVIEDHDDIATLLAIWDRLRAEALPRAASLDLIEEVASTWT